MLEQCPLLAQSGHHDGAPECLLSGAKRTLRGHALMAAFDRKRTSGGARLREGQREKGRQQKIADTEGVSFLRFQNWARGRGAGPYAVFPIAGPFRFCFFTRRMRLCGWVKMTHRGSQFFLVNWLKKAR
jgi:hypothetical protein